METNVLQIVSICILLAISAIAKSVQDKLNFHFHKSVFKNLGSFWNPKDSWKNKYKNNDPKQGFKKITIKIPVIEWKKNG